jgi:hypothetical protein
MSGSGAGFFNQFPPWGGGSFPLGEGGGGGGGQQGGGQRGPGRGGNHPERRPHGPGGPCGHVSFEDDGDYEFADDSRD